MALDLPLTSREHAARYRAQGLWRDRTLHEYFAAAAARLPDKVAMVEGARKFTYGELARLVAFVVFHQLSSERVNARALQRVLSIGVAVLFLEKPHY